MSRLPGDLLLYAIGALISLAVGGLLLFASVINRNDERFAAACEATHGTAVHDGRQWQCLPKAKP